MKIKEFETIEEMYEKDDKKQILINNMDDLYHLLNLITKSKMKLIFRGHAKESWKLESSYFRKHKDANEKEINKESQIFIFQERMKYLKEKGIEKKELETLAEMQHHGLETLLIDFTSNILNAIWFAFAESQEKEEENQSIFILHNKKENKYKIDEKFKEEFKVYECPLKISRGLSQRSYFILDNIDWNIPNTTRDKSIKILKININKKIKEKIFKFLDEKQISASKIYPDLKGLMLEFESYSKYFLFDKGNKYFSLKIYEEAINMYDEVIKIDPKYAKAYNNRGVTLNRLGKYEEAIVMCDKAIEIDSKYAMPYNDKGVALSELGGYEESIEMFDKAIEIDPNYANAYNNKGFTLNKLGEYKEAIEMYDKAIEIDSEFVTAYNNKEVALNQLEKKEQAKELGKK